jgi:hypothetical protein
MIGAESGKMVPRGVERAVVRILSGRRIVVGRVEAVVALGLVGSPGQYGHVGAALASSGGTAVAVGVQTGRGGEVV